MSTHGASIFEEYDRLLKVLLIGDSGVDKAKIMVRYVHEFYGKRMYTIGKLYQVTITDP